jgi:Protein of unknown function (DUF2911)
MRLHRLLLGLSFFTLLSLVSAHAQNSKSNPPSPMKTFSQGMEGGLTVKMEYSAPSIRNRSVWGGLVPYDKVWRAGANKATTFEINQAVSIEGQTLPAGKYSLFIIPSEKEDWTIVFNKQWDQWGAYSYKKDQDALRIKVKPESTEDSVEQLDFSASMDGLVFFSWEKKKLTLAVKSGK